MSRSTEHGGAGREALREGDERRAGRAWSPGFEERLRTMAADVAFDMPEELPASPYRDAVLAELAED